MIQAPAGSGVQAPNRGVESCPPMRGARSKADSIHPATLICLLLLALALRLGVSDRPLWFDESCTYWEASYPSGPRNLTDYPTSFSPAAAYLIKPLVGRWEAAWMLRLPLALLGVASIWIFILVSKELFDRRTAVMVGGLLAVSPFHVFYSTELRVYALVLFGSALNFFCFLKLLSARRWRYRLGACLGAVVSICSHPFSALLLVAQGAYLLIDEKRRRLWFEWLALQLLIVISVLPAIWYGYAFHEASADWLAGHPLLTVAGTLYSFTLGMSFLTHPVWYLLTVVSAAILGMLLYRGIAFDLASRSPVTLCLFVPLALAVGVSLFTPFYNEGSTRYLCFAQPFLLLLLVLGLRSFESKAMRRAAGAAVLLILLAGLYPLYFLWEETGLGNPSTAARILATRATPQDEIIATRFAGLPIAFYLPDDLTDRLVFADEERLPGIQPRSERVWIVSIDFRSQWQTILDPRAARPARPIWHPPGYRLELHEALPGRRPYQLTLFRRTGS